MPSWCADALMLPAWQMLTKTIISVTALALKVHWAYSLIPCPVQHSDAHDINAYAAETCCPDAADCTLNFVIHHQLMIWCPFNKALKSIETSLCTSQKSSGPTDRGVSEGRAGLCVVHYSVCMYVHSFASTDRVELSSILRTSHATVAKNIAKSPSNQSWASWTPHASLWSTHARLFDFSNNIGHFIGNTQSHRNYAWPIEIVDVNSNEVVAT